MSLVTLALSVSSLILFHVHLAHYMIAFSGSSPCLRALTHAVPWLTHFPQLHLTGFLLSFQCQLKYPFLLNWVKPH